jgi:hypothetical protein
MPPDQCKSTILPGPRTRDTEDKECQCTQHILAIASTESGLINAGPCRVPPPFEETIISPPRLEAIQCEEPSPIKRFAFLPWRSNGLEHGLKRHKIAKNGYVYEIEDRPTEPKRKSKAVSTRQWEGR